MNLDITPEVIVKQLKLGATEATLNQAKKAIENTKNFNIFSKHILGLNDNLKHMNGYIALSNSEPYFKIKCESTNEKLIEEFHETVNHFATKYHLKLQKVDGKNVYYIIGRE